MTSAPTGPPDAPGRYEIRIQGRLDPRWSTWLDGMEVEPGADGTTVLVGHLVDQSALHGVLTRLRDIGLPLISVARTDPGTGRTPTTHNSHHPTGD